MGVGHNTMYKSGDNPEDLSEEDGQWVDSHSILFRSDIYKSRMAVLNACIGELSRNRDDIQKIEIFEDPPIAIINIGDKELAAPAKKSLWRRKSAEPTDGQGGPAALRLKLDVKRTEGEQAPFEVSYKIQERS